MFFAISHRLLALRVHWALAFSLAPCALLRAADAPLTTTTQPGIPTNATPKAPSTTAAISGPTESTTRITNPPSNTVAPATSTPPPGHSMHGEVFNEGPRQRASLLPGMGKVHLEITSAHPMAQAFFNQGVAQLHGFWFFEAERSFRQVISFDTNCAMAYWGMAMANRNNTNRAPGFIRLARDLRTNASPREILWIDTFHNFLTSTKPQKEKATELVGALESIIHDYPRELEAKAFLAFQIWFNQSDGVPVGSRQAVDALISEVLAAEPLHPVHHARIHLWDGSKPARALESAARCGQSAAGIAHMWHMPGHTYSGLKRYADAAWQQEASARVDHAHMMAARILPDQIHNFAHNNQWLSGNLLYCGRVRDAMDLAKNMIELPRHPAYNTLNRKADKTEYEKNFGSSMHGRRRLLSALTQCELWKELTDLADTMYLEPTDLPEEQAARLHALALAHRALGNTNRVVELTRDLDECWKRLKQERFDAAEKAEESSKKDKKGKGETAKAMVNAMEGFNNRLQTVENYRTELKIEELIANGMTQEATALLDESKNLDVRTRARLSFGVGNLTNTISLTQEVLKNGTNEAPALALAAHLFWKCGDTNQAINTLQSLRALSERFDLETPIFARLAPIAHHLGLPSDWRVPAATAADVGTRPALDWLGPFRWQPYKAPAWKLTDAAGKEHSLASHVGHPVLVVFYLGHGCPHCIEQLNLLAPVAQDFQAQGISIVAVSTDTSAGLEKTMKLAKQGGGFPFPLVSDKSLTAFKAYRAYDEFEEMPLHGTFLIDGDGRVRWQDIGYEPFRDMKFLLDESRRLLGLPVRAVVSK